jgi:putative oxidoreductase
MQNLNRWESILLSILRFVTALLFIQYGLIKFFAFPMALPRPEGFFGTLIGVAGGIELVTGTLILVGLFTRPAAFVASGTMAAAYFLAHATQSFWPAVNQGGMAIMFCFVFLYISVAGAGSLSVDAALARRSLRANP